MNIVLTNSNGVTLKTKGKYCNEDIHITADKDLIQATTDATALASDIRAGQTAYINEGKVEGLIEDYNGSFETSAPESLIVDPIHYILNSKANDRLQSRCYTFYNTPFVKQLEEYKGPLIFGNDELANDTYVPSSSYYSNYLTQNWSYLFANSSISKLQPVIIKTMVYHNGSNHALHDLSYMFYNCKNIEEVTIKIMFQDSGSSHLQLSGSYMFGYSTIKTVNLSVPKRLPLCYIFQNAPELDTINITNYLEDTEGIVMTWNKTSNVSFFSGTPKIQNVKFKSLDLNIQIGSGTSYGHNLTIESLLSAIQACKTSTTAHTLTVGTSNKAKLAEIYLKIIDELEVVYYPFEVCSMEDEGAMTIQDYLALKNWRLA